MQRIKKVLLFVPPAFTFKKKLDINPLPPLGLGYLAAVLDQHGYRVNIIDALGEKPDQFTNYGNFTLRGLTLQEIIKRVPKESDLIGISNLYTFGFIWI